MGHMMLSEDEWGEKLEKGQRILPYMDVILKSNAEQYMEFVHRLFQGGMVNFIDRPQDLVCPFFVAKKNKKLRLVLDCRSVNERFHPPPSILMAAGATWANLEMPAEATMFIAQSDIKDYFYSLGLPEELQPFFSLPAIPVEAMQAWGVDNKHWSGLSKEGLVAPCFRVVSMGWSWAMYWAQRVHQHQALIGSGLSQDRLLVADRIPPSLDEGEPFIIAYADNLNVGGLDQEKVQVAKDGAVARLRSLGFGVHEEVDASTLVDSLGFQVDGNSGLVTPIPQKLGLVIAAFRFLATGPRINGKGVEKLIGHAVHFMLIRRELLCCMRSLYDFVQHSYWDRTRLWKSAVSEARVIASLLCICFANLKRPWCSEISCSDASLSGIAVCSRRVDPTTVKEIAQQRENWRFKRRDFTAPRVSADVDATAKVDPFSDVCAVKPIHVLSPDPFMIDESFCEVPDALMDEAEWQVDFASYMAIEEAITILESRGVVAAFRRRGRDVKNFGTKILHLNDNLANVLGLEKGRSSSYPMLRACRRLCALALALNSGFFHRWIPSEKNVSDHASRQWEHLRKQQAKIQGAEEEATTRSFRTGPSERKDGEAGRENQRHTNLVGDETISDQKSYSGSDQRRKIGEKKGFDSGHQDGEIPEPIISGTSGSLSRSSSGLSEEDECLPGVFIHEPHGCDRSQEVGRVLDRVSQQHVRGRLRHLRRKQNPGCSVRLPARLFPQEHDGKIQKMLAWLDQSGSRSHQTSTAVCADSFDCHPDVAEESQRICIGNSADVLGVSAARRSSGNSIPRCGTTITGREALCHQPAPNGKAGDQQDGPQRRVHIAGLSSPASAGFYDGPIEEKDQKGASFFHRLFNVESALEGCPGKHRPSEDFRSALSTEALGAFSRQAAQTSKLLGGEAERKVGGRLLSQEIRGSQQTSLGISKSPSRTSTTGTAGRKALGPDDAQIQVPTVLNDATLWVVEIFSGCGNLSKACGQQGFATISIDINFGKGCDLLRESVLHKLLSFLKSQRCVLVWLGMPCTSWSRARKHDNVGPPPLRDDDHLWGLPNLSNKDNKKVLDGNKLLLVTVAILHFCTSQSIAWVLENPWTSRAWLTEPLQRLQRLASLM